MYWFQIGPLCNIFTHFFKVGRVQLCKILLCSVWSVVSGGDLLVAFPPSQTSRPHSDLWNHWSISLHTAASLWKISLFWQPLSLNPRDDVMWKSHSSRKAGLPPATISKSLPFHPTSWIKDTLSGCYSFAKAALARILKLPVSSKRLTTWFFIAKINVKSDKPLSYWWTNNGIKESLFQFWLYCKHFSLPLPLWQLTKVGEGEFLVLAVSQGGGAYLCEAQSRRGSQRSRPVSLPTSGSSGKPQQLLNSVVISCVCVWGVGRGLGEGCMSAAWYDGPL